MFPSGGPVEAGDVGTPGGSGSIGAGAAPCGEVMMGGGDPRLPALRSYATLIDVGLNLPAKLGDAAVAAQLRRAAAAGVGACTFGPGTAAELRALAALPGCCATFGPGTAAELRALAALPGCCAVGECGLDYTRDIEQLAALDAQLALHTMLALAASLDAPVFLHPAPPRHADVVAALDRHRIRPAAVCVHCVSPTNDDEAGAVADY
eukprot:gene39013-52141_t